MTLGEWLSKQGIGQAEFAERAGVSQGHISKLVRNPYRPRISAPVAHAIEKATRGAVRASSWSDKRLVDRGSRGPAKQLPNHTS